ncbi:hypothetical protein [Krasilnikovia sp. MM14-A1259]
MLTARSRHAQILIRLGIGRPTFATPRRSLGEVLMTDPVAAVGTPR